MSRYGITFALFLHLLLLTGLCDEGSITPNAWALLAVADVIATGILVYKGADEDGDDS